MVTDSTTEAPHQGGLPRRVAFIEATLACLAEFGYHGTTVRRIAARAGAAPGLLRHYFPGKEALIAEAYRTLSQRILGHLDEQTEAAGPDPLASLEAFITASFQPPNLDPAVLRAWMGFWTLVFTDPEVHAAHAEGYRLYRARLARLIADALSASGQSPPPDQVDGSAIGISALLDGLWLEWCLDPSSFDPAEGRAIALRMIAAALDLPALASAAPTGR